MDDSKIDDTYSECFTMWYSRILITAITKKLALAAARNTVGFASSIIMCSAEAGIERTIPKEETPDGRPGVIIQIWVRKSELMKDELIARLSQCAMTTPTTNIFNYNSSGEKSEPIGKLIAYFGDGHQRKLIRYGCVLWEIPVMDGILLFEETFHFSKGIAGGVIIIIGDSPENILPVTFDAVEAIHQSASAITSFPTGICRAGSKIGSKYSFLNESINHKYCPTLKGRVPDSLLPPKANCAYEIVINATTEEELKKAMRAAIKVAQEDSNVLKITSANYDGKLGPIKIHLKEL
jgi:formylmethanofuran--tetrahydromethanopterin N-formyltransferase